MDKKEKAHTPRNVSRIFMLTTALQCSILSLSISLSLSLISLAGHHLVAHCAKSVQRKAACWPKLAGWKLASAGASALQLSAKTLVHWPFRLFQHAILPIYISHRGKPLDIPGSPGKASNKLTKGDRISRVGSLRSATCTFTHNIHKEVDNSQGFKCSKYVEISKY